MKSKLLLTVTAILELATGLALLAVPSWKATLLLGVGLDTPAPIVLGRVAGAALLAIGVSCGLESRNSWTNARPGLIGGLLVYNVAIPVLLVGAAFSGQLRGLGLWPVSVAHTASAV